MIAFEQLWQECEGEGNLIKEVPKQLKKVKANKDKLDTDRLLADIKKATKYFNEGDKQWWEEFLQELSTQGNVIMFKHLL